MSTATFFGGLSVPKKRSVIPLPFLTVVVSFLLFFSGKARAEIIALANGSFLEGTIIEEDEKFLTVEVPDGKVKVLRQNVKTIWRGTKEELLELRGPALHLVKGYELYEQGKFKESLDAFKKASEEGGRSHVIYANLGSAYASLGERLKAEQAFLTALEKDPASRETHLNLANLYMSAADYEQAIEHYEKSIELSGEDKSFYRDLAYAYYAVGNYAKALELYERLERQGDIVNLNNQAATLIQLGKLDEAEAILTKLAADNPTFLKPHLNLAELYKRKGEDEKAIHRYRIVLSFDPKDHAARLALGQFYMERGLVLKAEEEFKVVLEGEPDHLDARYSLAEMYTQRKAFREAIEQHEKILEHHPEHLASYNNIGLLYLKMNQPEQALAKYAELFAIDDNYPKAHVNAGLAHVFSGDVENAKKEWDRALELDPTLESALTNKRLLEDIFEGDSNEAGS